MSAELSQADYSYIPEELLDLIFKRLKHVGDAFRFEAVCKLWKAVGRGARSQQQVGIKLSPMIFFTPYERWASRYMFCNSTQGWIVTINLYYKKKDSHISLVNPLSRSSVSLPPLQITKAIASSSPLDPNCIVLAFNSFDLGFCRPCQGTWRVFENVNTQIVDIIYYKKNFYALDNTGKVLICDLGKFLICDLCPAPIPWSVCRHKYLVESSGDLLLVTWHDQFFRYFQVRKLDFNYRDWIKVRSLGDNALLWSGKQCLSVSSNDFPEFKSNCIYFFDYGDLSIFDLNTRKSVVEKFKLSDIRYSYLWFTPDIMLPSHANAIEPLFHTNSNVPLLKRKNLFSLH